MLDIANPNREHDLLDVVIDRSVFPDSGLPRGEKAKQFLAQKVYQRDLKSV